MATKVHLQFSDGSEAHLEGKDLIVQFLCGFVHVTDFGVSPVAKDLASFRADLVDAVRRED